MVPQILELWPQSEGSCADPATDGKTMGNAGRVEVSLRGTIGGSCRAPAGPFPQRGGSPARLN